MDDLISKVQQLFSAITARSEDLRFNRKNAQQLNSVCHFGSILESMSACLTLLRSGDHSALPGTLRSLVEAYIDLLNLVQDPDYIYKMHAAHIKEQAKGQRAALASQGCNPYLTSWQESKAWRNVSKQS